MRRIASAEAERTAGLTGFATTVARNLFKLMAYKDEYEVAGSTRSHSSASGSPRSSTTSGGLR